MKLNKIKKKKKDNNLKTQNKVPLTQSSVLKTQKLINLK